MSAPQPAADAAPKRQRLRTYAQFALLLLGIAVFLSLDHVGAWLSGSQTWSQGLVGDFTAAVAVALVVVLLLRHRQGLVDNLRRAAEAAEEQRETLRLVSDAMLDPEALLRAVRDERGVIIDFIYEQVNRATSEYLGMPREALLGQRLLVLSPAVASSPFFPLYLQAMESGERMTVQGLELENDLLGITAFYDVHAQRVPGDRLVLTWRDVTDERHMQSRLAASEVRFRLLAEHSSDVILLMDNDAHLRWVSPSALPNLGWHPDALLGRAATEFVHPDDLPGLIADVERSNASGELIHPRFRWRRPDGTYRWVEAADRAVADDGSGHPGRVATLRDIHERVADEEQLHRRATVDLLTGAVMREVAFEQLERLAPQASSPGEGVGVLFVDLDEFKCVNDDLGHAAGDAVLRTLAQRFRSCVRSSDTIARMGGDEFLIILDRLDDLARAVDVANKLRQAAAVAIATGSEHVTMTLSIGVTTMAPGEAPDATVARADAAMYEAKRAGRDRVVAIPAPVS